MDIMELLPDSSKLTAVHAANIALQKPEIIPLILELALADKLQYSTRAANTIEIIDSKESALIKPFYYEIIEELKNCKIEGVRRCLLKIFTRHTDIKNEKALCSLINFCFAAVISPDEAVAVKVYSLEIIYKISNDEPDLKNELIFVIKDQITKNSAGFRARGNQMLKKLYKEES